MAGLRDLQPALPGRRAGRHPKVVERDGEAYRDGLAQRARRRGGARPRRARRPLPRASAELAELVRQADVVLLPYDSREQVTSGVLIEAVAAGRPVVSTGLPARGRAARRTGRARSCRSGTRRRSAARCAGCSPSRDWPHDLADAGGTKAPELLWAAVADRYRGSRGRRGRHGRRSIEL